MYNHNLGCLNFFKVLNRIEKIRYIHDFNLRICTVFLRQNMAVETIV